MPIIKKAPAILTREVRMEEPVSALLDDYAQFIESSADHVVNSVLKKTLWRDQDYRKWREGRKARDGRSGPASARAPGEIMMRRILASRHFVAAILAMATGTVLFYARPFPEDQLFLRVIAMRAPHAFLSFRASTTWASSLRPTSPISESCRLSTSAL